MKTHILATISLLSFIGICFWGLQDPKSFILVLHGILGLSVLVFIYYLAYEFWKGGDHENDYEEDNSHG
jgi:hypothetical protein